jgi:cytidylate kinase
LKIFLEASIEERARRRQRDFANQNVDVKLEVLIEEISKRDNIDSTRKNAPLKCAVDALVLDSTAMSIDEVVECVQKNIRQRCTNKQSADIS